MTKLEIKAEKDEDIYDIQISLKCLACGISDLDKTHPKVRK